MGLSEVTRSLEAWVAPPGTSVDGRRKRIFVCLGLAILIPVTVIFAVDDLRQGNSLEGSVVVAMAIFLAAIPFVLARASEHRPIFRLGALLTLLLQFYELEIGAGFGFAFLWFYCFPILAIALLGQREGAAWALAALASAAVALLTPVGYVYQLEAALRFLISYTLVAILSYGLEASRERFYSQLLAEKIALEEALSQVKTLRGLLPICGGCKRIRNDGGYWQQIEEFVDDHSLAEFSHGVCPSCAEKYFPGLAIARPAEAELAPPPAADPSDG